MLLLISESRDRGSETKFQQAMEAVERQGIEVFGTHYSAYATSLIAKPKDLPELPPAPTSDDPEDRPQSPPGVDFLAMIFEARPPRQNQRRSGADAGHGGLGLSFHEGNVESRMRSRSLGGKSTSQYILSFPQRKNAAGMHQIEVLVPNHGDLLYSFTADLLGGSAQRCTIAPWASRRTQMHRTRSPQIVRYRQFQSDTIVGGCGSSAASCC